MISLAIILSDAIQRSGMQSIMTEYFPEIQIETVDTCDSRKAINHDLCITDAMTYITSQNFFAEMGTRCAVVTSGMHWEGNSLNINTSNKLEQVLGDINSFIYSKTGSQQIASTTVGEILSSREIQVLVLIVSGEINKEIATRLNISLNTVLTHRKNITSKLGIKTVPGLTLYALMNGYIKG